MKRLSLLFALAVILISTAQKCGSDPEVGPESAATGCFANSPLETIPWAKDQLVFFQRPKSGPLRVVVLSYQNEQYLAFGNGFISSPDSYVFNCSGVNLIDLKINSKQFSDQSKVVKVLLEGSY